VAVNRSNQLNTNDIIFRGGIAMAKQVKTMDGNQAASYMSYAFTDVAAIYPITPSSNMAEECG
jgi:hypothetical protein